MPRLTVKTVAKLEEPGMYGDGQGLYLRVGSGGAKSWVLRTLVHGRRQELGLGSASLVSLGDARDEAQALRRVARAGGDPKASRDRTRVLTFEDAARAKLKELEPTWKNSGHGKRWIASLEAYAFPLIGDRNIQTVGIADVLGVLNPIWTTKNDTARRVKQRIAVIFDWAKGNGHYFNENPVNGVERVLPPVKKRQEHMAALPWVDVPAFYAELGEREGVSARSLSFLILTCSRSGEARGARWAEINGDVWEIPAERMKAGSSHRVPLCEAALEVLESVRGLDNDLIFPSAQRAPRRPARQMSDAVFKRLQDRMGRQGFTVHGFRSSFRDWCSESAHADREVAEAALAHTLGNKVEQAYARSDLFDRRRNLMDAWGRFVTGQVGEVVELVRA
ncbi:tyrosine-type recombinase/integrase [Celeribacter sp.]|uniref:tyrosine-type recombinase/integrase n=1 Tax=Celeribacter sp. TaxID=1890673 RepID=UPI003A91F9BD